MTTRRLLTMMAVMVIGVFGYASVITLRATQNQLPSNTAATVAPEPAPGSASGSAEPSPSASSAPAVFDVRPLMRPARKYLGVAMLDVPQNVAHLQAFTAAVGTAPNVITIYESFDDQFAAAQVRAIYQRGALAIIRWEPTTKRLADIAAGAHDKYILDFAAAVRRLNLPIALTVAHEMNGDWYPWGTRNNTPAEFVGAWRRVHQLFAQTGATNVIWAWTPNAIQAAPRVRLAPYYPGDQYVDWVGIDAYYTQAGIRTFRDLFGPTMAEIRRFTTRPFIIVETGAEAGSNRLRSMDDLFTSVANDPTVLGFVYFNQRGSKNWAIDNDPAALNLFRQRATTLPYGFVVK
jgi:mannan endo-1,4-beta-mannosidase